MRIPDELTKPIVFFGYEVEGSDHQPQWKYAGTGFLVGVESEAAPDKRHVYLVTAKHVVDKLVGKNYAVRANTRDGKSVPIFGKAVKWYFHPNLEQQFVDVAVVPYAIYDSVEIRPIPFAACLKPEEMGSNMIGIGSEVFMTGLFTEFYGSKKNLPILRMGNVAMIPDEPVDVRNYGKMEAYLIEARSLGGLSGSPVFVRHFTSVSPLRHEYHLMGLMHGHWDISPKAIAGLDAVEAEEQKSVNMGIGIVVPAQKIKEVIYGPELTAHRKLMDEDLSHKNLPVADSGNVS